MLVVADDAETSRSIAEALASDYRIAIAKDGREGLDTSPSLRPDVIVTDLMMPRMGGDAMVREIRARHELDDVPIVSLGAKADDDLRVRLLREGVQDYVTKPFAVEELRARVDNLVAMKRARAVLQRELRSTSRDVAALASALAARTTELEAALRKVETANRLKDAFLRTASHELRTPLTPILGWAQVLRRGSLQGATYERAVEAIDRNARAEAKLVDDLIDMSLVLTGDLRIERRAVELAPVVEVAVHGASEAAADKGVEVRVALDRHVGPVSGDAHRLRQIVAELLANAIKFTPRGGHVEVRLDRVETGARIAVTDNGPGITLESSPDVFDPVRQHDGSLMRAHGGLGLGLSVARALVEVHGGTLRAESARETAGTMFIVQLPLADVASA